MCVCVTKLCVVEAEEVRKEDEHRKRDTNQKQEPYTMMGV